MGGEEREGQEDEGVSVLTLDTEKEEITETVISCKAENSEGVVSETLAVNTQYLPKSIKINGPSSMKEGEEATVSCLLSNSFPVPEITWTMEKSGDKDDIIEKRADVSGAITDEEEETLLITETLSLESEAGLSEVRVSCAAHVEGLGSVSSETVTIEVEQEEMIDYTTTTENIMDEESESQKKDTDLFEDFTVEPSLVEGNSDEEFVEESADEHASGEKKEYVKLITEDDDDESYEADATEQRDKILWIPYNSEEDIEDYQNNFSPKFAFNADATEFEVKITHHKQQHILSKLHFRRSFCKPHPSLSRDRAPRRGRPPPPCWSVTPRR